MYVLLELLLRPPFGVGILLPTLGPEVPDFDAAGPFPAVETDAQDTEPHEKRNSYPQVGCRLHSDCEDCWEIPYWDRDTHMAEEEEDKECMAQKATSSMTQLQTCVSSHSDCG